MSGTYRHVVHDALAARGCQLGRVKCRDSPLPAAPPPLCAQNDAGLAFAVVPHRFGAGLHQRVPPTAVTKGSLAGWSTPSDSLVGTRAAVEAAFGTGVAACGEHALALRGRLLEHRLHRVDDSCRRPRRRTRNHPSSSTRPAPGLRRRSGCRGRTRRRRCWAPRRREWTRRAPASRLPECRSRPRPCRSGRRRAAVDAFDRHVVVQSEARQVAVGVGGDARRELDQRDRRSFAGQARGVQVVDAVEVADLVRRPELVAREVARGVHDPDDAATGPVLAPPRVATPDATRSELWSRSVFEEPDDARDVAGDALRNERGGGRDVPGGPSGRAGSWRTRRRAHGRRRAPGRRPGWPDHSRSCCSGPSAAATR